MFRFGKVARLSRAIGCQRRQWVFCASDGSNAPKKRQLRAVRAIPIKVVTVGKGNSAAAKAMAGRTVDLKNGTGLYLHRVS
jgi:hypothetical protein